MKEKLTKKHPSFQASMVAMGTMTQRGGLLRVCEERVVRVMDIELAVTVGC